MISSLPPLPPPYRPRSQRVIVVQHILPEVLEEEMNKKIKELEAKHGEIEVSNLSLSGEDCSFERTLTAKVSWRKKETNE